MCVSYESVESNITPRLQTSEDSEMQEPSTRRTRSPTLRSRVLSDNHEFSFLTVEFEQVGGHRDFYFMQAVTEGLWRELGGS